MRTSKKDVEILFNQICVVFNLKTRKDITTRRENPNQLTYNSDDYYMLDYNSVYGGFSFIKVLKNSSQDFAFNMCSRYSTNEAYHILRGILASKSFDLIK